MQIEPKGLFLAICGSILLAPLLLDSLHTGRWPLIVLALFSAHLITQKQNITKNCADLSTAYYWGGSAILVLISYFLEIDKALYLAGAILIAGSLLHTNQRPLIEKIAILICIWAIVPIPAGFEAALANLLSNVEATIFVALGQLAGQPLYQVGSQVVLGGHAVTINSDCSGTLLLLPSVLGCLVAASTGQRNVSNRTYILLAALPLAILINLIRIAFLLTIGLFSPETPLDDIHDVLGWVTMSIVWLIPAFLFAVRHEEKSLKASENLVQVGACLLLATMLSFSLNWNSSAEEQTKRPALPLYVNGWIGEDETIPPEELSILNADSVVRRRYTSPDGDRTLLVTEIYHQKKSVAEQHNSAACFRAMGWQATVLNREKLTPNSTMEHLIVRDHLRQQAVTEVTLNMHIKGGNIGFFRLQIVETNTVPSHDRRTAALTFLKAAQLNWSNMT